MSSTTKRRRGAGAAGQTRGNGSRGQHVSAYMSCKCTIEDYTSTQLYPWVPILWKDCMACPLKLLHSYNYNCQKDDCMCIYIY